MARKNKNRNAASQVNGIVPTEPTTEIATVPTEPTTALVEVSTIDNGKEITVVKKVGGRKKVFPAGSNGQVDDTWQNSVWKYGKRPSFQSDKWTLGLSQWTIETDNPVPCLITEDNGVRYELHLQAYPTGNESPYYVARALLVGIQSNGLFGFARLGYATDLKGLDADTYALLDWPESGRTTWKMMQRTFSGDTRSADQKNWLERIALLLERKTGFNATDLPIVRVPTATCEQYLKEVCGMPVRWTRSSVDKRPEVKAPAALTDETQVNLPIVNGH